MRSDACLPIASRRARPGRHLVDARSATNSRFPYAASIITSDEASWWAGVNVDPVPIALALWRRTCADGARGTAPGGAQPQSAMGADGAGQDQTGV
jgi:hypothetical protein